MSDDAFNLTPDELLVKYGYGTATDPLANYGYGLSAASNVVNFAEAWHAKRRRDATVRNLAGAGLIPDRGPAGGGAA